MNIVKLKDIILTEENAPQLTEEQRELFNTKFRGRYVYAVNWKYCIPLEDMTTKEYVQLSRILTEDIPVLARAQNQVQNQVQNQDLMVVVQD